MTLFNHFLLLTTLAASTTLAHAGTITYNITGASTSAGTLTGSVALDTATDLITSARLTFNDPAVGSPVFTRIASSAAYNGLGQDYISGPSSSFLNYGAQAALFFNTAKVGSASLSICAMAAICGTQGFERSFLQVYTTSGTISSDLSGGLLTAADDPSGPAAATPEPSSLLMLGTGIFGVAGLTLLTPLGVAARRP